jgi:hypothetical protein
MNPMLTVFVDEAGDPGIRDGLRYSSTRHEWFCLAGIIVRSSRLAVLPDWIREIRSAANSKQAPALHYHRINRQRRNEVCRVLATKPCRAFVLASHKSNMRYYINHNLGAPVEAGTFYNWCLRLLLERMTAWAAEWLKRNRGQLEPLRVVLARRGHDYNHLFSYVDRLRMQKLTGTLLLKGPGLAPELLERANWTVESAEEIDGLQLADVVASAFYQAANSVSPAWDLLPATSLGPIIAKRAKVAANYGVTVFPLAHQAELPEKARMLFRSYGYSM